MSCLVGTLGDLYVDANPEQEEEDSKAHEEWGHQGDEELFVNIACVLGRGDLVNEEPGSEEHADGQKYHSQVREDSRVHWAGVPTHGFELHFAPHRINHRSATGRTRRQLVGHVAMVKN